MKNIYILLILMTCFSLFAGMSINGNWFFVYQFEMHDYPEIILLGHSNFRETLLWLVIVLAHSGCFSLFFLVKKSYFSKALLYFPLVYLTGYLLLRAEFLVLLIPFTITWIIALRYARKLMVPDAS